jgi:DNA-binding NarL/FixJ family response regulator
MSDREIGEKLSLSLYTVKDYRKSIYEKVQINKVPLLTLFAARHGLISLHGNAFMETRLFGA